MACGPGGRDLVEGKVTSDVSASFPEDEEVSVEAKRMKIADKINYLSELKRKDEEVSVEAKRMKIADKINYLSELKRRGERRAQTRKAP